MHDSKWFLKPMFIFIFSVIALAASLFLYIYWYVEASAGLRSLIERFNIEPEQALASDTWVVILVVSILFGIILMGFFIIFVYSQKALQLYRLQHNFIDNFTHELKTPVTSLKLYLETFCKYDIARQEQLKYIGFMLTDVNRLSDTINSMLDLSKLESKSYAGEFVQTDLVEAVTGFFDSNRHLFSGAGIRIEKPAQPMIHPVNRSLLEILLMNLSTNAVKYNRSPNATITVSFDKTARAHLLRMKDNGIGIEKSEIKKIFKKFFLSKYFDQVSACLISFKIV